MRWLKHSIGNLFFPPKCVFCGAMLPFETEPERAVCHLCEDKLSYAISLPKCKGCGKPVEENDVYCDICRKTGKRAIRKMVAPYLYQKQVKRSILRFKREAFRGYAKVYARHMQAVLEYECPGKVFDVVVSAPPRIRRLHKEHYDQAEWLARTLAKRMGVPYGANVLKQKEKRRKQSSLSLKERWQNAEGNICVKKPEKVENQTVLLVDDVCTTGATLYYCATALKEAGAKAVYCATAAVVARN